MYGRSVFSNVLASMDNREIGLYWVLILLSLIASWTCDLVSFICVVLSLLMFLSTTCLFCV